MTWDQFLVSVLTALVTSGGVSLAYQMFKDRKENKEKAKRLALFLELSHDTSGYKYKVDFLSDSIEAQLYELRKDGLLTNKKLDDWIKRVMSDKKDAKKA